MICGVPSDYASSTKWARKKILQVMNAIKLSNIWTNDAVDLILQRKWGMTPEKPRNWLKMARNGSATILKVPEPFQSENMV